MHLYFPFLAVLPTLIHAQAPQIPLGTSATFAIVASDAITNTGNTFMTGNVALYEGTSIGLTPGQVSGAIYSNDGHNDITRDAKQDSQTAYDAVQGLVPTVDPALYGKDLGGTTLGPGVYAFGSSAAITGDVTLDARGNSSALFVFQITSSLTMATDSRVLLAGSAQACNIFWQVGSSATLITRSQLVGRLLALVTVTLGEGASVRGGVVALTGEVTLINNNVEVVGECPTPSSSTPATISATSSSSDRAVSTGMPTLTHTTTGVSSPSGSGLSTGVSSTGGSNTRGAVSSPNSTPPASPNSMPSSLTAQSPTFTPQTPTGQVTTDTTLTTTPTPSDPSSSTAMSMSTISSLETSTISSLATSTVSSLATSTTSSLATSLTLSSTTITNSSLSTITTSSTQSTSKLTFSSTTAPTSIYAYNVTSTTPSHSTTTPSFAITYISGTPCTPTTYYAAACTCLRTSFVPLSAVASTASIAATISGVPCVEEKYFEPACGCVGVRVVPIRFAAEGEQIGGENCTCAGGLNGALSVQPEVFTGEGRELQSLGWVACLAALGLYAL